MANKDDSTEHEPLTEEQRITALEEKVGANKVVLLGIALFLIIVASIASTLFVISFFGDDDDSAAESEKVLALEEKLLTLEKKFEGAVKVIKESRSELNVLKEKVATSSNAKLQEILVQQEQGHQMFLDTIRSGMYDLAHMIPGSRTWLEVYGEKVDSAERHSKNREKELINLQKGILTPKKITTIQEDPFEEGF